MEIEERGKSKDREEDRIEERKETEEDRIEERKERRIR